jgi:hypothetical protein
MQALLRVVVLVAILVTTAAAAKSAPAPLSADPASGNVRDPIEISGDGFSPAWQGRYVIRAAYPAGNQNFTHIAWHTGLVSDGQGGLTPDFTLGVDGDGHLTFLWTAGDAWELTGTWSITVWDQSGRKAKLVSSRLDVVVTAP